MRKILIVAPEENWIVDRMVSEILPMLTSKGWRAFRDIHSAVASDVGMVWLIADWCVDRVPYEFLKQKNVLTTIHHIVPDKFFKGDWDRRDAITDAYHVFNERTLAQVKSLTTRPVYLVPYWANDAIWTQSLVSPRDIRRSLELPANGFLCGSFQRDTEGAGIPHGVYLPKLEKGADRLADAFIKLYEQRPDLHVVLAGWRRQYIIGRLEEAKIPYTYFELPSQQVLNELYNVLDMYVVTARHEGGPQALLECGLTGTPCVSTPVGIAEQVLPHSAISDDVTFAIPAVPNVTSINVLGFTNHDMRISRGGMNPYIKLIEEVAR